MPAPGSPDDVVVTVGDAKLTRGELDADVAKFIEARRGQIPPEQLEAAKNYLAQQFKEQFVTKTLLLKEAAKKGLTITDAAPARTSLTVTSVPSCAWEAEESHPW